MWARNIDGILTISEDLAEMIKKIAVPGAHFVANGASYTLGTSLDLERTGNDERWWFYADNNTHALFLLLAPSENTYEMHLVERKVYWFGIIQEKHTMLTSLTFPDANISATPEITTP